MCALDYWQICGAFTRNFSDRKENDYYKFDREREISKADITNNLVASLYEKATTTASPCAQWLIFNIWRLGVYARLSKIKKDDMLMLLRASAAAGFAPAIVGFLNSTLMLQIFQDPKFIPSLEEREIIIRKLDDAMNSGNYDAFTMRANLIRWGKIGGSMEEALYLLQSAIARGDPDACYVYAELHHQLAHNPKKACFYLELAKYFRIDYENLFQRPVFDSKINVLSREVDALVDVDGARIKVFAAEVAAGYFELPLPEVIDDSDQFFQRALYHQCEPRLSVTQLDAAVESRFQ